MFYENQKQQILIVAFVFVNDGLNIEFCFTGHTFFIRCSNWQTRHEWSRIWIAVQTIQHRSV